MKLSDYTIPLKIAGCLVQIKYEMQLCQCRTRYSTRISKNVIQGQFIVKMILLSRV